jgi:hypothetical protein
MCSPLYKEQEKLVLFMTNKGESGWMGKINDPVADILDMVLNNFMVT